MVRRERDLEIAANFVTMKRFWIAARVLAACLALSATGCSLNSATDHSGSIRAELTQPATTTSTTKVVGHKATPPSDLGPWDLTFGGTREIHTPANYQDSAVNHELQPWGGGLGESSNYMVYSNEDDPTLPIFWISANQNGSACGRWLEIMGAGSQAEGRPGLHLRSDRGIIEGSSTLADLRATYSDAEELMFHEPRSGDWMVAYASPGDSDALIGFQFTRPASVPSSEQLADDAVVSDIYGGNRYFITHLGAWCPATGS